MRRFYLMLLLLVGLSGCLDPSPSEGELDLIWGRVGLSDGRFQKPRALAIDKQDQIYVVDMTGRVQCFTAEGEFLRKWTTPKQDNGRPTGLGVDRQGRIMVADTHYFRVLFYSPDGELVDTIGGTMGQGPGEFGFVTDAVQDSRGNYYISEYGQYDRVQKFTAEGEYLLTIGRHGSAPSEFVRPQALEIDEQDRLWVADSCNHRIQIFSPDGELVQMWGEHGSEPGQLSYPYGIVLDGKGHVYLCEYGNHRVQKFTAEGKSLGCWGEAGRREGQLFNPWSLVIDSQGRVHVLDTNNHRLQRIFL